jgi:uncharacterized membrane protein YfcA
MTALLGAAAIVLAAVVKGSIGFGFPTLATPLLALAVDVKTAVAVTIVPNLVMDGWQAARRGGLGAMAWRLTPLLLGGAVGTIVGTRLLIGLPPSTAAAVLGGFLLAFVLLNATRVRVRVPVGWEPWLSPVAGLGAGIIGGITNVPGTPLVIYFYALGLEKGEFVRATAISFVVLKLTQLAAVAHFGLMTWPLLAASFGLTAVAMGGFLLGLQIQDRLDPVTFNRVVLGFLTGLGVWLIVRALA